MEAAEGGGGDCVVHRRQHKRFKKIVWFAENFRCFVYDACSSNEFYFALRMTFIGVDWAFDRHSVSQNANVEAILEPETFIWPWRNTKQLTHVQFLFRQFLQPNSCLLQNGLDICNKKCKKNRLCNFTTKKPSCLPVCLPSVAKSVALYSLSQDLAWPWSWPWLWTLWPCNLDFTCECDWWTFLLADVNACCPSNSWAFLF